MGQTSRVTWSQQQPLWVARSTTVCSLVCVSQTSLVLKGGGKGNKALCMHASVLLSGNFKHGSPPMAALQKCGFCQNESVNRKVLKYNQRETQLWEKPVPVHGGCDCGCTQLLNVIGQANSTLLVSGRPQTLTQWQPSKLSLALNTETVCTCESLIGCLQAQSLCSCLFGSFDGGLHPLCTRSAKLSQPAEEGWMLHTKFPSHCSMACRWWVTCRNYLKPLRDTDGLAGPEDIPTLLAVSL